MKQVTRMAVLTVWLFSLGSCMTEKKARRYLNEHELFAAQWCATKFPVIPSITIDSTGDSAKYKAAYLRLMTFADSVMRANALKIGAPYWASLGNIDRIRDSIKLRQALSEELERALKPCVDKIIREKITVVDSAKMRACQLTAEGALADKQKYVNLYGDQVTKTEEQRAQKRNWMWGLIILGALNVLYVLLRFRGVLK